MHIKPLVAALATAAALMLGAVTATPAGAEDVEAVGTSQTAIAEWPGVSRLLQSSGSVPYGDARHFSRSSDYGSGQTPVRVASPVDAFYGGLIQNSVNDWTGSNTHAISYYGYSGSGAHCYGGQYGNCITVGHDSSQPCGGGEVFHFIKPSFGHNHVDEVLVAVNLSSACTDLWHAQNTMCRLMGKALGVTGTAGSGAPCVDSLHPWPTPDISTLNFIGAHYHGGSIHLPPGV